MGMRIARLVGIAAFAATVAHAQTAEIAATVVDAQAHPVADAVVVAVPADGSIRLPTRLRDDSVDQVDKEFFPRVKAILVGTSVTRSEERRVGKECRTRWTPYYSKTK